MCGLVGIFGKDLTLEDCKMFYNLLHFDQVRGEDSTGVLSTDILSNVPVYKVFKQKYGVETFINSVSQELRLSVNRHKNTHTFRAKAVSLGLINPSLLMGHNRAATQGAVTQANAHPFEFDNVIGAHNGTLEWDSLRSFALFRETDSDSKCLFREISDKGIENVYSRARGAMALTFLDKRTKTFNLIKNYERPLYIARYTSRVGANPHEYNKLAYASEEGMIRLAFKRNHITSFTKPEKIEEHHLYSFTLNPITGDLSFTKTELTPAKDTIINNTHWFSSWGGGGSGWGRYFGPKGGGGWSSNIVRKLSKKEHAEELPQAEKDQAQVYMSLSDQPDFIDLNKHRKKASASQDGDYVGPMGAYWSRERWENSLEGTHCAWCGVEFDFKWEERDKVIVISEDTWLCYE